jgi:hypothetical protein
MTGALFLGVLWQDPAGAWPSANRYGGSTSHSEGETSHTNAYGGSSSHSYGQGTEHTNAYGGSSAHAYRGGTEHTNAYGGTTSGAYGQGATHTYTSGATAYHPPGSASYSGYSAYHAPVAVPYYSASGCNGCAAAAGAIVGATAGVAIASAGRGCVSPCTGCLCGFAGRMRLPTHSTQIRLWRNVACPSVRREWRLLPSCIWSMTSTLSFHSSDQEAASNFEDGRDFDAPIIPHHGWNVWSSKQ